MNKKLRIAMVILLLGLAPAGRYLADFQSGYMCEPEGASMASVLCCILIVPVLTAVWITLIFPLKRVSVRIVTGFAAVLLSATMAIFMPPGAVTYSKGFESAVRKKVGVEKLQRQCQELLARHQAGTISATNEPEYWNVGDQLVATNELPDFFRTGLFTPGEDLGPEIAICKKGGRLDLSQDCIAISWYLHGLLVGPPEFTYDCRLWYCQRIAPGVYSYHGYK